MSIATTITAIDLDATYDQIGAADIDLYDNNQMVPFGDGSNSPMVPEYIGSVCVLTNSSGEYSTANAPLDGWANASLIEWMTVGADLEDVTEGASTMLNDDRHNAVLAAIASAQA